MLPAATVTEAGTAAAHCCWRGHGHTAGGGGPLKVMVPVEDVKLATLVGLTDTEERVSVAAA